MTHPVSDLPQSLHKLLAERYVLKRELGRGGAATVYLAHDVRHERLVAIKVLHPELSHALGAKRFLREIKLTASLQHPHILPIHDSGEVEDQLFYVMPYVEGDSLRQRLGADNRLSIEEAVRVGREVAGALAYAHERGVVHRDIKPENILFSGGHAVLADFGIARAIDRASDKITQQGMITGTPAYMSPEQARDRAFDGRSDVYSLACVLYEAIAGVPPFQGDTPQQLLSQRVAKTPPLLREYRHDVPGPIESVIARALAISPDDRFDDARAFSAALSAAIGNSSETLTPHHARRPLTRSPWLWAAGVTLAVAGGAASSPRARDEIEVFTRRIDTAQYAVVPFQYVGASAPANDAEPTAAGVYDALRRWDGLHLASEIGVSEAVRQQGPAPLTLDAVTRVARSVRAGRAVWGRVRVMGDSLVVRAGVYDAITGENLREVTRVVRSGGGGAARTLAIHDLDFRSLTTDLLRESRPSSMSDGADRGTTSYAAWLAFDRAAVALDRWDVGAAERELQSAVDDDPAYPHANLWLAQLKLWHDDPAKEWSAAYIAADHGRALLDPRERGLVDGMGAFAREDHPGACRAYDGLRRRDSLDVVAWLGLAFCQARDPGVVVARGSPSGLAYRASTEGAWRAISRALELEPRAFAVMPYLWLRDVLIVEHNRVRQVRGGSVRYSGLPVLINDTIAYVPYPPERFANAVWPAGYDAALRVSRDRMLTLLELLTRRLPENPDAFEALTLLLEARDEIIGTPNGRYSALTALERARTLATDPDQRTRLAVADVRLHLKLGDFARSSATADSLLRAQQEPTPAQADLLAGMAAFTGRAAQAVRYQRMSATRPDHGGVPALPAAEEALLALQMRAALGICDDSIATLTTAVEQTIVSYVGPADRPALHDRLLERPLMLAAPCSGARTSLVIVSPATKLVRAQQRAARGDVAGLRLIMDSLNAGRRNMRPGALSLDNLVQEAWLQDFTGDPRGAAARLDVTLNALPTLSTLIVSEPVMAAAVGRAMAYRAELAVRLDEPATAALWAGRVLTLWSHADASLAPTMARMQRLAGHRPMS